MVLYLSAAFEYPSITNKEIIQYNTSSVPITQAPIRVCLDGTIIIDSRTIILVTNMYYLLWLC